MRGGGGAQLTQLAEPLLALAQAVYTARASRAEIGPETTEAVATLCGLPSPLAEIGAFLRAVAAASEAAPPLPAGLPAELARICEGLKRAVGELPEWTVGKRGGGLPRQPSTSSEPVERLAVLMREGQDGAKMRSPSALTL